VRRRPVKAGDAECQQVAQHGTYPTYEWEEEENLFSFCFFFYMFSSILNVCFR